MACVSFQMGQYDPGMRPRLLALPAAVLLISGCGSPSPETVAEPATEISTPETIELTVEVIDRAPLQLATNKDDVECYPSAATVGASKNGAQWPQITVRDAGGTVVGTAEVSVSGAWADDACSMPTLIGEVPASDFYSLSLIGDGGIFKVESHEFERTVESDPVDGKLVVEWEL